MPIYEYRCKSCGKEFEVMQKFSDKPVKECIHCGSEVEKLISQSSFVLKGGGWYQTDYASKGKGSEPKDKKGSGPGPGCGGCSTC